MISIDCTFDEVWHLQFGSMQLYISIYNEYEYGVNKDSYGDGYLGNENTHVDFNNDIELPPDYV